MVNELIQYVRVNRGPRKGEKRGVVIAKDFGKYYSVGWSYAATSKGDRFNKEVGLSIARERAEKSSNDVPPWDIAPYLTNIAARGEKYFRKPMKLNDGPCLCRPTPKANKAITAWDFLVLLVIASLVLIGGICYRLTH